MATTRRHFVASAALCSWAMPAVAQAGDNYPLWELRDGKAKVFLFGDCGSATDPWKSARVSKALDESTVLWIETPQIGPAEAAVFREAGSDLEHPLSTKLSETERAKLAGAAQAVGVNYADLESQAPWLAASTLNARSAGKQSPTANPSLMIGRAVLAAKKPIRTEFPDIPSLVKFFQEFHPRAEVEYLMNTVDLLQDTGSWLVRQQRWERGDISMETERVLRQMEKYPAGFEAGTGGRNRRWAQRIARLLGEREASFVLVGATHLVGPSGVLNLLAKDGLTARRI